MVHKRIHLATTKVYRACEGLQLADHMGGFRVDVPRFILLDGVSGFSKSVSIWTRLVIKSDRKLSIGKMEGCGTAFGQ